jgi:O-antigen/teichoic acid export membrane protein
MIVSKRVNSSLVFLFSKYFIFGIQFLNAFLLAVKLGPYFFGIWAFISLVLQYFDYFNLGVANAVNVFCSFNKNKIQFISRVVGNSTFIISILNICALVCYLVLVFGLHVGEKYELGRFFLFTVVIFSSGYFISLLSNVLRVYDRLIPISLIQSFLPLGTLIALLIFDGDRLLQAILWFYTVSNIIALVILILKMPFAIKINFNLKLSRRILGLALPLFFYNASFYFIFISVRSLVSKYYSIEEFGFFTFTFSIANIIVLITDSLSFLIWPKLLNKFNVLSKGESLKLLVRVRRAFLTFSHLGFYCSLLCYPIFIRFMSGYEETYRSFLTSVISVVLLANSFGFQSLIIAKRGERFLAVVSFVILVLCFFLSLALISVFKVKLEYAILGTALSYFIFNIILANKVYLLLLGESTSLLKIVNFGCSYRLYIPLLSVCPVLFIDEKYILSCVVASTLIFLGLNWRSIRDIIILIVRIIKDPDFLKI